MVTNAESTDLTFHFISNGPPYYDPVTDIVNQMLRIRIINGVVFPDNGQFLFGYRALIRSEFGVLNDSDDS